MLILILKIIWINGASFSCSSVYIDVVKELINAGADLNIQDDSGATALHEAALDNR